VPAFLRFKLSVPVLKNRFEHGWLWYTDTFMGIEIQTILFRNVSHNVFVLCTSYNSSILKFAVLIL